MQDKILMGTQVLVGLMLLILGLNGFLHFMPMGEGAPEAMGAYMGALFMTGYMFPLISVIKLVTALSFLSNKFAALTALFIMPVILNALLAHLFLDPAGMVPAAVVMILIISVMFRHKARYAELFKA